MAFLIRLIRICVAPPIAIAVMVAVSGCSGGAASPEAQGNALVINGILVPPAPDATANQTTMAGVDSNSNGIRDDIERQIATDFGATPDRFAVVSEHARLLQAAIVSPAPAATKAYVDQARCISSSEVLRQLDTLSRQILDTPMRQRSYGGAMAGTVISLDGC